MGGGQVEWNKTAAEKESEMTSVSPVLHPPRTPSPVCAVLRERLKLVISHRSSVINLSDSFASSMFVFQPRCTQYPTTKTQAARHRINATVNRNGPEQIDPSTEA